MKKYFAFAAAALMLASCSNDDVPQDNLKDTPITVTAGVAELKTRAGYVTPENGDPVLPETFYLSIDQEGTTYDYTNVEMTNNGSSTTYTPADGSNLLWASNDHNVPAINAYTTDGTTFTVQTDQSATDGSGVLASDLLGAIYGGDPSDITINADKININFRHLLCKLDVTFTWGTELQVATITSKSIKSVKYMDFGTDVTLNRAARSVTAPETPTIADIIAYMNGTTSEAIFAPHVGSAPKIVITTDITTGTGDTAVTEERMFSLDVTAPTGGFVSGNRYTMNVTIGGTAVDGGSVTATIANGWGETVQGNMATN